MSGSLKTPPSGDPTVTVASLSAHGDGLAPYRTGQLVVPGAWPGEQITAKVLARSRHAELYYGQLHDVVSPHPGRVQPSCASHIARTGASGCTGCPMMTLNYSSQLEVLRVHLAQHFSILVDTIEPSQSPWHYRQSAKRIAGEVAGKLVLGSPMRGTRSVASMVGCQVDHPKIVAAFEEISLRANALGIPVYSKSRPQGLRYVWAKTNGEQTIIALVTGAMLDESIRSLADQLTSVDGVSHCMQADDGNEMRGNELVCLRGLAELSLTILGQARQVGPLAFMQPNPAVAQSCYLAYIDCSNVDHNHRKLAYDLYAGPGITTAALANEFARVVGCERWVDGRGHADIVQADVFEFLRERRAGGERPDAIFANPPRAGLGETVCAELLLAAPQIIHLMSCSPQSLRRDLDELAPSYRLVQLQAFDTLPHTPHVELVARLCRVKT